MRLAAPLAPPRRVAPAAARLVQLQCYPVCKQSGGTPIPRIHWYMRSTQSQSGVRAPARRWRRRRHPAAVDTAPPPGTLVYNKHTVKCGSPAGAAGAAPGPGPSPGTGTGTGPGGQGTTPGCATWMVLKLCRLAPAQSLTRSSPARRAVHWCARGAFRLHEGRTMGVSYGTRGVPGVLSRRQGARGGGIRGVLGMCKGCIGGLVYWVYVRGVLGVYYGHMRGGDGGSAVQVRYERTWRTERTVWTVRTGRTGRTGRTARTERTGRIGRGTAPPTHVHPAEGVAAPRPALTSVLHRQLEGERRRLARIIAEK
jgi:hypothetical protein